MVLRVGVKGLVRLRAEGVGLGVSMASVTQKLPDSKLVCSTWMMPGLRV